MNTPDTEWDENTQHAYDSILFNHNPIEADKQFGKMLESVLNNLLSSRDTYWKEVLQGVYGKGLPTIEQIKQSALGWGKEGSERYEGYIQGAKDVNGLVIWELCSHGIPLNLDGKPPTPITNEDKK